ncbi:hypothetical protein T484DRAFT_1743045 [Baffinella frigidus]|nr:hypothetical protein T484DRAFT_1743045 [Cryptophyta sp. CCMP2293]
MTEISADRLQPSWDSSVRYRRPRHFRELPRCYPRTLRLAARGAMPSKPSLLPTIIEVDESLYLYVDIIYFSALSRSPSPLAAECGESSRKRRTPERPEIWSDLISQIQMCNSACKSLDVRIPIESLQTILTEDGFEHWKRLRGARFTA